VIAVAGACSGPHGNSAELAVAHIDRFRIEPDSEIVYPGSELSVEIAYSIESPEADAMESYYAAVEVSSLDHRQWFLDACGGAARRPLPLASGRITLRCRMRLDPVRIAHDSMLMRVRIYQQTSPGRSVMLASSEAAVLQLRVPAIEPWQRVFMDRCPPARPGDGGVIVCRS
jgi:hypothetical protein